MFSAIYIEKAIREHERVRRILTRNAAIPHIEIERYGEVFNRSGQNFRIQKQAPALILAEKHGRKVLPTPPGYGFEVPQNRLTASGGNGYYFSHMMNCVYDCRYCFLQGMYRSANYVLFVNYEDFADEIMTTLQEGQESPVFYSGYDCDSLALEPVSEFCEFILPLFRDNPAATLELRSKSTQVRKLLQQEPMANCVVAMSFAPAQIAERWEQRVPALEKRIDALARLQEAGWPVALRFEPVIATETTEADYETLFTQVFSRINANALHSCSLGEYRLPQDFYKRMVKLYPDDALLARDVVVSDGMVSLRDSGSELLQVLETSLMAHINPQIYYRCA